MGEQAEVRQPMGMSRPGAADGESHVGGPSGCYQRGGLFDELPICRGLLDPSGLAMEHKWDDTVGAHHKGPDLAEIAESVPFSP